MVGHGGAAGGEPREILGAGDIEVAGVEQPRLLPEGSDTFTADEAATDDGENRLPGLGTLHCVKVNDQGHANRRGDASEVLDAKAPGWASAGTRRGPARESREELSAKESRLFRGGPPTMKSAVERILVVALCAAIGWFYTWTVRSSGDPWKFGLEQRDYYNLLIDGWLDGHLHMKVEVPAALLQLKDPYDPAVRPAGLGLHDATFFQGKYYVYFGMAPVVLLMLPFRLWSGIDLPQAVAALIFVYGAFLASVAIWLAVRRRYFPGSSMLVGLAGVLVLGLAGLGPVLLRRPHMWELPIGAGSCFAMLALLCVWRSLHARRGGGTASKRVRGGGTPPTRSGRAWWFGGAGLCLGLAIASRPTYLIASPFLAVPLLWWWATERRWPWRPLLGALVPLVIIGSAMAWHNYARFGDPLQFGQAYQLSLDYESKMAHFRVSHVPFNVWRYFFSAAEWSRYFPFIQPAALPPKPPGFGGHDDLYGILRNLPIAWLALAAPLAWWRRDQTERRALRAWLTTTAVLFGAMAGTLIFFFGSLARYQSDFTPALMLLAGVGGLAVERWLRVTRSRPWLVAAGTVGGGLVAFSAGFAMLFSLQLDGLLREKNPARYREVALSFNRVPAAVEQLAGVRHGPLELTLRIGTAAPGTRELLLAAGEAPTIDRLHLVHQEGGRISFEAESSYGIREATPPVAVDRATDHRLRVLMGVLLPPEMHPVFASVSAETTAAMIRRLRIEFDGALLVDRAPWFSAPAGAVQLATAAGQDGRAATRIIDVRRDEVALAVLRAESLERAREAGARMTRRGTVLLQASLPHGRAGVREPLLVMGRPGRGDLIALEYGEGDTVRFCFDHWGGALLRSDPVAVDFGRPQEIRIAMESLRPPSPFRPNRVVVHGQLEVWLNGRSVWRVGGEFFAVNPVEIAVARNPIGGTTCGPEFSGVVHGVDWAAR